MRQVQPMLAGKADPAKLDSLRYPLIASPKVDGIRSIVHGGRLLTRKLEPIPNRNVYADLSKRRLSGLDGELVVGSSTGEGVFSRTTSGLRNHTSVFNYTYWVFDVHNISDAPYSERREVLEGFVAGSTGGEPQIQLLPQQVIYDAQELDLYEIHTMSQGYEGIMLRDPNSPYKYGRSTYREGYLLKLKRFEDSEALIIGFEEEMFNGNVAERNELGRTKRSSAKAGLSGKGTLGKLIVRDLLTGVEFGVGTGFTAAERQKFWDERDVHLNFTVIKYKFFPVGVKDLPRHPVYLGIRMPEDM